MSVCPACGGLIGRDCWNPQECAEITADISRQHPAEPVGEVARLRAVLGRIARHCECPPVLSRIADAALNVPPTPVEGGADLGEASDAARLREDPMPNGWRGVHLYTRKTDSGSGSHVIVAMEREDGSEVEIIREFADISDTTISHWASLRAFGIGSVRNGGEADCEASSKDTPIEPKHPAAEASEGVEEAIAALRDYIELGADDLYAAIPVRKDVCRTLLHALQAGGQARGVGNDGRWKIVLDLASKNRNPSYGSYGDLTRIENIAREALAAPKDGALEELAGLPDKLCSEVRHHIREMYPNAVAATAGTFLLSVGNHVRNKAHGPIMRALAALSPPAEGEL